jgi:micrococcal nuclease
MKRFIPVFSVFLAVALYFVFLDGIHALGGEQAVRSVLVLPAPETGAAEREGIVPGGRVGAEVIKVVDGDTIDVRAGGKEYRVRLLCIDAPESVKRGVEPQPFGKASSERTEKLVSGKKVKLVFDKDLYDRYGRLLAFVVLGNGECLNALLVYGGYARVEIVSPNKTYGDWFYELQKSAISKRSGLWALSEGKRPFVKGGNGEYIPRYLDEKAS